jgi:glycosyltransferase involved in cell wall biosynthesis
MSENSYSIIIPTHNNFKFIDECLNSVVKSFKSLDYEILVGVDNCRHTKKLLVSKTFSNTKVYWSSENIGPFTIKNNLSLAATNNYLVFFDSDDIMYEDCATTLDDAISDGCSLVRFKYDQFMSSKGISSKSLWSSPFAEGVFCIKSSLFRKYVGFMPWRCAADTEFGLRLQHNREHQKIIGKPLFLRRIHSDNLTIRKETNHASTIRKSYTKIIHDRSLSGRWDNPPIQQINLELI